jgi:mRNA-capping enzyme
MGKSIGILIPMKTPITTINEKKMYVNTKFTPQDAHDNALKRTYINPKTGNFLHFKGIGGVIDLSRANNFYNADEFSELGILYEKIPCAGYNDAPNELQVNTLVYKIRRIYSECLKHGLSILLHCTHGFNRSGFMILSFWLRLNTQADIWSLSKWINFFATSRPPGINKNKYIEKLYEVFRKIRPSFTITISSITWRLQYRNRRTPYMNRILSLIDDLDSANIKHDNIHMIGENICSNEQVLVRYRLRSCLVKIHDYYAYETLNKFPGCHPVSLSREHIRSIITNQNIITWKADGTRCIMLIESGNVFLIDRKMDIVRIPGRFLISVSEGEWSELKRIKISSLSPLTIFDGEMLVNKDFENMTHCRKFLIFDLMYYKGRNITQLPFKFRYTKMCSILSTKIKNNSRNYYKKLNKIKTLTEYEKAAFLLQKKDFYKIQGIKTLFKMMMPKLSHNTDGLVFQCERDSYSSGTSKNLLKWKSSDYNSVDFLFRVCEKIKCRLFTIYRIPDLAVVKEHIFIYHKINSVTLGFSN